MHCGPTVRQDSDALLVHISTFVFIVLEYHALEGSFFHALHKLFVGKCILFFALDGVFSVSKGFGLEVVAYFGLHA